MGKKLKKSLVIPKGKSVEDTDKISFSSINEDLYRREGHLAEYQKQRDSETYQALIKRIHDLVLEGVSSYEIYAILVVETEQQYKKDTFDMHLKDAYLLAENSLHKDLEYTFRLHMDRYESIFNKSIDMTDYWGRPLDLRIGSEDRQVAALKYAAALKALKSKEDLIGLHDKSMTIEFNENKPIVIQNPNEVSRQKSIYWLTMEEKIEFLSLLKDARTVPIEGIQRVVIKQTKIEINQNTLERNKFLQTETHDIEFEEMPKDVVSKMEKIERPIPELEPEIGPIVLSEKIEQKKQIAQDLADKINKNLIDSFKKKMKEKKLPRDNNS